MECTLIQEISPTPLFQRGAKRGEHYPLDYAKTQFYKKDSRTRWFMDSGVFHLTT